MELSLKQQQFNAAMERYTGGSVYKAFGTLVSLVNISLQCHLLYRIWPPSIGIYQQVAALVAAWLVADFVNGLVHMYMDNNDRYESLAGPLIANFHLHHKTPRYQEHNLLVVYFMETGSKVWLVPYLAVVTLVAGSAWADPLVVHILVYTGILSSVAEVSHYLCHTSVSPVAQFLGNCGLLLSKRHHARHHLNDNTSYAFLNGVTDPLLDRIAAACYPGYKQTTDLHYAHYAAGKTGER